MRLRNIKGAREAIEKSPFVELAPEDYRGRWRERFGNGRPIWLEVGMGKGQFIMELARRHPEINFIGVEMYSSVLIRAVQKREQEEMVNLLLLRIDARTLPECFAEGEVERIFLNFSDPWPKDRHAKRRLTSRQFLERYTKILDQDGQVEFKTDNHDLYIFSRKEQEAAGWRLLYSTEDLHRDEEAMRDNVMTEYEERFSAKGNPIYKMVIRQPRETTA